MTLENIWGYPRVVYLKIILKSVHWFPCCGNILHVCIRCKGVAAEMAEREMLASACASCMAGWCRAGVQAYYSALVLAETRSRYPEFCIPMVLIPATIGNNVPGTEFSIGSDTALNEIMSVRPSLKTSLICFIHVRTFVQLTPDIWFPRLGYCYC